MQADPQKDPEAESPLDVSPLAENNSAAMEAEVVEGSPPPMSSREVYNVVTDTVAGPNLRIKDNLLQGLAIFVSLNVGVVLGAIMTWGNPLGGMIIGGLVGLLIGLFGSGIFLMIYRAFRH